MRFAQGVCLLVMLLTPAALLADSTIVIHPDQVVQPTNKLQSGVCIEDVNHEIYGGLYSQMIFGESFQEPAVVASVKGFEAYGGNWNVRDQAIEIDGNDGPKLISNHAAVADATVNLQMKFAEAAGENAGLVLRVSQPGIGPDTFTGYELSLSPSAHSLRLARHRNNYDLICHTPCEVPVQEWFDVKVKLQGQHIEVFVKNQSVLKFDDHSAAFNAGAVGLRAWHSRAMFRNLMLESGGKTDTLAFEQTKANGDVSAMWQPSISGSAEGAFTLDKQNQFLGSQSQRMTFISGEGEIGLENRGLNHWGMNVVAGKSYEGCLWVRAEITTKLTAVLESADGTTPYGEQLLDVPAGDWKRLDFAITATAGDTHARFALKLKKPGSVTLGYVFLQPGAWGRFENLPVRRDVVQGLIDQGVSVIRYGGSMVNSPNYRWKKMIGPRDRRPPYSGLWYPYSSNGWSVVDFLNLCEAIKITGIPDLNVNESPADMADFIEYVNGSAESEGGKRRAEDGHPGPYHLTHLELGNEESVNAAYADKFNRLAEAIWAKDPDVILVAGDFGYKRRITDPDHITHADGRIANLDGQRQILNFAKQHDREVWFDVHVWSERLQPSEDLATLPSYIDAIDRLAEGAKHRVVVFELNANSHGQGRALANAMSINTLRRDNRVPVVISANGLQPDGQNDNGWDQGLLFLNPSQVWLHAPGYVTQMQARNELPKLVKRDTILSSSAKLDVTVTCSEDGKSMVVQVVNLGGNESATIDVGGFLPAKATAHLTELTAGLNAANTAAAQHNVEPKESEVPLTLDAGKFVHSFPAHSFSIIRFE